jgi:uncharacterized protein YjaG (DUF416 family)
MSKVPKVSKMSKEEKHLWEYVTYDKSFCDVDPECIYESFATFLQCTERSMRRNTLVSWTWVPSMRKARKYNIKHVLDKVQDIIDESHEYDGELTDPCADGQIYKHYKKHDYLIIRLAGQNDTGKDKYKIIVRSKDEVVC